MKSGSPRHPRALARYLPILSFVFLCFLGDAAEGSGLLDLGEIPATLTEELGETARNTRVDVHGGGASQSTIDLTSLDQVHGRSDRFSVSCERVPVSQSVERPELQNEQRKGALAFLVSRPTRAGP